MERTEVQIGAKLSHVSTYRPKQQKALKERRALLGRWGGEEPLHKSEACAGCIS